MFPKVFPVNPAETEDYPSLSNLEAIYHTCPFEQYKYGLPVDESVGRLFKSTISGDSSHAEPQLLKCEHN